MSTDQLSCRMSLNLRSPDVFSWLDLSCAFLVGLSQKLMSCPFQCIILGGIWFVFVLLLVLSLITQLRCYLPGFSTVMLLGVFPPLELINNLWEGTLRLLRIPFLIKFSSLASSDDSSFFLHHTGFSRGKLIISFLFLLHKTFWNGLGNSIEMEFLL